MTAAIIASIAIRTINIFSNPGIYNSLIVKIIIIIIIIITDLTTSIFVIIS